MKNVYIYCEGPTEESFINEILYPYFFNIGIAVYPIVCTTKRTASKKYKGGVSDYNKIKRELTMLCKSHPNEHVTTISHLQGCHKEKPPEMDGFNYFRYSPRPEGGSLGYSSSSKLSNGPLRPERWSLVYSTFSSTPLSISFLACAEGSAE